MSSAPHLRRATAVAFCLFQTWTFASWVPRPLRQFQSSAPAQGSSPGLQRFRHHERTEFKDGGSRELLWEVDADPDTILAMDVEQERGARVLQCWNDQLVLQVPTAVASQASQWQHVTASEATHGCGHLAGKNLYHKVVRVEDVRQQEGKTGHSVVVLETKELTSPSQIFPHCHFSFRHVPAKVKEYANLQVPELPRNASFAAASNPAPRVAPAADPGRRLSATWEAGSEQMQSSFTPDTSHINSILQNINAPEQTSNLEWDWDYDAHSTRNPQFRYVFPGGIGYMKLYKPHLKAHFVLTVNFTSRFGGMLKPPDVNVVALLQGFADFNADIATAVNFQEDKSASVLENILDSLEIPGFPQFKLTRFKLKPITFSMGGTPMTVNIGYRCGMKAYHLGLLQGSLRVGLATKLKVNGIITLNMEEGLKANITAEAVDVKFTPPTWMLFTNRFELGAILEPEFYVKGSWGDMPDMRVGLGLRPYLNVSIRQDRTGLPDVPGSEVHMLAIYPVRAINLPPFKNYVLRISANDNNQKTLPQTSTGILEFKDNVQWFSFGVISEGALLSGTIEVEVLEISEAGQETSVGKGQARCSAVSNGVCKPEPLVVKLQVEGKDVYIQLTALWQDNALGVLEKLVRSLTIRYPQITINSQSLAAKLEDPNAIDHVELRITRNGRSFSVPLETKMKSNILYESLVYFELGPAFLDAWKYANSGSSLDAAAATAIKPKVELTVLGEVVGVGTAPPVGWDQPNQISVLASLQNMFQTQVSAVALMVPLYDPNNEKLMVGTAELEVDVAPASMGAFFVEPAQAAVVHAGETHTVHWVTNGAAPGVLYNFTLTAFTVDQKGYFSDDLEWRMPLQAACSKKSRVPLHTYAGDIKLCVFSKEVPLPIELAGSRIVFVARWLDADYNPHEMVSTVVTVAPRGSARRLDGGAFHITKLGYGKDGFSNELRDHLAQLRAKCSAAPLKYRVNAGVNFVEHMKNVYLPMSLMGSSSSGMYGGNSPEWTSKPLPVFKLGVGQHAEKLSQLLPKSVCAGGVCDGMMPGCQKTTVNPISIKQIVFKLSRQFDVHKHLSESMRHAVAYGLAILPSAIKIGEREVEAELEREREQQTDLEQDNGQGEEEDEDHFGDALSDTTRTSTTRIATTTTTRRTTTTTEAFWAEPAPSPRPEQVVTDFNEGDFLPPAAPTYAPSVAPSPPPYATEAPQRTEPSPTAAASVMPSESDLDIFDEENAQPVTGRRLLGEEDAMDLVEDGRGGLRPLTPDEEARLRSVDGDGEDEEAAAPFNRFVVRITQPMHYEITEDFLRTLLERGAFRFEDGREAELGPVRVVSAELRREPAAVPDADRAAQDALSASASISDRLGSLGSLGAAGGGGRFFRYLAGAVAGFAVVAAVLFAAAASRHGYIAVAPSDLALLESQEFA